MAVEVWSELVVPLAVGLGGAGLGAITTFKVFDRQLAADRQARDDVIRAEREHRREARQAGAAAGLVPLFREFATVALDEEADWEQRGALRDRIVHDLHLLPEPHRARAATALDMIDEASPVWRYHYVLSPAPVAWMALSHAVACLRAVELGAAVPDPPDRFIELEVALETHEEIREDELSWDEDTWRERRVKWLARTEKAVQRLRDAGRTVPDLSTDLGAGPAQTEGD